MFAVKPYPNLVDQGWGKRVGPAQAGPLVADLLCALVEPAAIRKPGERAGLKGGLIGETVACENLVFVTEVLVNANVELVGPVCADGTPAVVVIEPGRGGSRKELEQLNGILVAAVGADGVSYAIALDLIPNIAAIRRRQPGYWIYLPCCDRSGSRRIEDSP